MKSICRFASYTLFAIAILYGVAQDSVAQEVENAEIMELQSSSISWYQYAVYCQKNVSASYNIKTNDCSNKCVEGHDCTNCSGWEVRRGWSYSQLVSAGTQDKTSCCVQNGSCGSDTKYSPCFPFSESCPANSCPGNVFSKLLALTDGQYVECDASTQASLSIPPQQLRVGSRDNDSFSCGSNCSNSDPFTAHGSSSVAFGYTISWSCDGQSHTDRDCTLSAVSACGDGTCEPLSGETESSCPQDCETCDPDVDPNCGGPT